MPTNSHRLVIRIEGAGGQWSAAITEVEETRTGVSGPLECVLRAVNEHAREFEGRRGGKEPGREATGIGVVTGRMPGMIAKST